MARNPQMRWSVDVGMFTREMLEEGIKKERVRRASGYQDFEIEIKDPLGLAKSRAEPIFSGPQAGEKLLPFTFSGLRVEVEGKDFDPIASAGGWKSAT